MSKKRYLIECTYVFDHPQDNSGIQRVVRNVIKNLEDNPEASDCIPVAFIGGEIYQVNSLAPIDLSSSFISKTNQLRIRLEHFQHRYWLWHSRLERFWPMRKYHNAKRVLVVLARILALSFIIPQKLVAFSKEAELKTHRAIPLEVTENDCLVLLDSSWHANFFEVAERLKAQGVDIVSVIYDLIPLTNPEFCDEGLVRVFENWFDWVSETADGYVCISETIMKQVRAYIHERSSEEVSQSKWYRYFHLGSDLDLIEKHDVVDPEVEDAFKGDSPVYLMVSTIEPRKNHKYLLDAFDLLWEQGVDAKLMIIGKVGWKCDDLIKRIKNHDELNKRLFMFNKASDSDLNHAYKESKCLLFPSFVEGFGLPIVEAMQRDIPVMISDIPVFHEIGKQNAAYFDLASPESLAQLIKDFEATGNFPAEDTQSDWSWMSWRESTDQFLERVKSGLSEATV
ncbi:MAG: glycosyltransferase family 4 protein [Pseudomonadales bacterium]|nr:glycosyltransferase family 4 protein [Pseudomonadales bacterium]